MNGLTSILLGIAATLLTIFLTPRLQHSFWKDQRREELRLAAINKMNKLLAEFIVISYEMVGKGGYKPNREFFVAFEETYAEIKALFADVTIQEFKKVEVMIGPNLGPQGGSVNDFVKARDAAFRALYREVGLIK